MRRRADPPGPPPGPVKRWADMTPEERAAVQAGSKPPPKERAILPYFVCTRGAETKEDPVEEWKKKDSVPLDVLSGPRDTDSGLAEWWVLVNHGSKCIPKSQVVAREEEGGRVVRIWVTRWIAERKGLEP